MLYKLYNYLKDVIVTTNDGQFLLEHDQHVYQNDKLSVMTFEPIHNQINFRILNKLQEHTTLTVRFYNPIEDILYFLDPDGNQIPYTGQEQFSNIALIVSTWGTYIVRLNSPCKLSVTTMDIILQFELEPNGMFETTLLFEKFVPIHSAKTVLEKTIYC